MLMKAKWQPPEKFQDLEPVIHRNEGKVLEFQRAASTKSFINKQEFAKWQQYWLRSVNKLSHLIGSRAVEVKNKTEKTQ